MLSREFAEIKTSKAALHSIDIWAVLQFFVKRDSGGCLLCLLVAKSRVVVIEKLV